MDAVADRTRAGLMGPNHVRRLDRIETMVNDPTDFTSVAPSLDLDFTTFDGAPFDDFFSRSGAGGYRMNHKSVLVPTVDREPVIDFANGVERGTGFYGAYTNLLLYSEQFDNAAWPKTNVTVTANSVVAPDGVTTMDLLDTTVAVGFVVQTVALSVGSTAVHSVSVFLKQGTAADTALKIDFLTGGTTNTTQASINWATKIVTLSGSANNKTYVLDDLGNGFYRLTVSGSNSGGANTFMNVTIRPGDAATGTVYAWGAQLTATAFPVPYVPTTSAAVARGADSMVINGTDFTGFFNPTEGTFFVDFANIPPNKHLFHVTRGLGSYGPRLQHIININTFSSLAVYDDANTLVGYVETVNRGISTGRSAVSYKLNDFQISVNGSVAVRDTAGVLPTGLTRLEIARSPNQDVTLDGYIKRIVYWPEALTADEMQRMTA